MMADAQRNIACYVRGGSCYLKDDFDSGLPLPTVMTSEQRMLFLLQRERYVHWLYGKPGSRGVGVSPMDNFTMAGLGTPKERDRWYSR